VVRVFVDGARTTLAGTHAAGNSLRLALVGAAALGTARAVHVVGPAPLVIRL
jgi:hypothetical protein